MSEEINNNDIKKIIIQESKKIPTKSTVKQINYVKEKKMRVETKTWGLNDDDLSYNLQVSILKNIHTQKNKYTTLFTSHIKTKLSSYRQQDILKHKLNEDMFIKFDEVIALLNDCEMKCCYCSNEVFILYETVREMKQWSLDRINNDIGHNKGNLVIACLECNLKRRRTNKDAFMFTKNMVIIKEN